MTALLKRELIIVLMFIIYVIVLWLKDKDKKIKIKRIIGIIAAVILADVFVEYIFYLFETNAILLGCSILKWILTNFVFMMAGICIYRLSVQTEKSIRELCQEMSVSVKIGILCMVLLGILFIILDYQYSIAMLAEMQEALNGGDLMGLLTINIESKYSLLLRMLRILIPGCVMGDFIVKMHRNPNE